MMDYFSTWVVLFWATSTSTWVDFWATTSAFTQVEFFDTLSKTAFYIVLHAVLHLLYVQKKTQ